MTKKHILLPFALSTTLLLASCAQKEEPTPVITPTTPDVVTPVTPVTPVLPEPEEKNEEDNFIIETRDVSFSDENLALEGLDFTNKQTLVEYVGTETHLIIPEGVEVIGESALRMGNFESIVFPSTLEVICWEAVFNNPNLRSVELPEGLLVIDGSAFQYCHGLESLTLPQSLKAMTTGSFGGTGLKSIRLPEQMDYTAVGLFYDSEFLETVEVKEGSATATNLSDLALMVSEEKILTPTFY